MKRLLLGAVIFLAPMSLASEQRKSQTLECSGVLLRMGDGEDTTVAKLKNSSLKVVSAQRISNETVHQYIVQKNENEIVGVLTFKEGTLTRAYRDWSPDEMTAYNVVIAIQGAIKSLKEDGTCILSTGSVAEPNYSDESSFITCGNKYIEISGLQGFQVPGSKTVTVYEWIDDYRIRPKN
jgi:hypothetical protein